MDRGVDAAGDGVGGGRPRLQTSCCGKEKLLERDDADEKVRKELLKKKVALDFNPNVELVNVVHV